MLAELALNGRLVEARHLGLTLTLTLSLTLTLTLTL